MVRRLEKRLILNRGKGGTILPIYIIVLFIIIIMIFIFVIFAFKMTISSKVISVRNDLFYISQNCQMALNRSSLEYNEYVMDKNEMVKIAQKIIDKNYSGDVSLEYIDYDSTKNLIKIRVNLKVKPIIKIGNMEEKYVPIEGTYKLKLMEAYNG